MLYCESLLISLCCQFTKILRIAPTVTESKVTRVKCRTTFTMSITQRTFNLQLIGFVNQCGVSTLEMASRDDFGSQGKSECSLFTYLISFGQFDGWEQGHQNLGEIRRRSSGSLPRIIYDLSSLLLRVNWICINKWTVKVDRSEWIICKEEAITVI